MSAWLDPVRRALDERATEVRLFLRDDDAGWDDVALGRLIETVRPFGVPLDVAVIPAHVTEERAQWLLEQRRRCPAPLNFHQHGWSHDNHEPVGRKCEFGPARSVSELRADVVRGRDWLTRVLERSVEPIFTPPWNRCVPELGAVLVASGFSVLSRDRSAPPLGVAGLRECAVHVDWSAERRRVPGSLGAIAARCSAAFTHQPVVGLLWHHAVMTREDHEASGQLLGLLTAHPRVTCVSLLEASHLV